MQPKLPQTIEVSCCLLDCERCIWTRKQWGSVMTSDASKWLLEPVLAPWKPWKTGPTLKKIYTSIWIYGSTFGRKNVPLFPTKWESHTVDDSEIPNNHLGCILCTTLKIVGCTTNLNWLATFLPSTVCKKSCPPTAPPEWQLRQCYRGSLGEALWSGTDRRMVRIDGGIWTRCFNGSEWQIQLAGGERFGCLVLMLMILMFLGQLWVVEMIMLEHPTETQGQNCIVHTRKENTAPWEKTSTMIWEWHFANRRVACICLVSKL